MKVYGELKKAQLELITSPDATKTGMVAYNKTKGKATLCDASVVRNIFDSKSKLELSTKLVSSADYVILDNDNYVYIKVSTGATNRIITLPTLIDNLSRTIIIEKIDSGIGAVILTPEGAETIEGSATFNLSSLNSKISLFGDTEWKVISYMASSIATSLISNDVFKTGDYKHTSKATLSAGWVWGSGKTIGNAGSGSTERANADTLNLFTEYFDNYTDVELPLFDSAGGAVLRAAYTNAADAFGGINLCRMSVPDLRGRALVGRDDMNNAAAGRITAAGCAIDGTVLGNTGGAQTHLLTDAQSGQKGGVTAGINSSHVHDMQHTHEVSHYGDGGTAPLRVAETDDVHYTGSDTTSASSASNTGGENADHTHNIAAANAANAHNNTQPTLICNVMIKL